MWWELDVDRMLIEIDCSSAKVNWRLNAAGQATFELDKRQLNQINARGLAPAGWNGSNLMPGACTIWVSRETFATVDHQGPKVTQPIWGGMIIDIQGSSSSPNCTIVAEEFTGYYAATKLTTTVQQGTLNSPVDIHTVMDVLHDIENFRTMRMPLSMLPSTLPGFPDDPVAPRWYSFEDHLIGDLIRQMASSGNGFEWYQGIFTITNPVNRTIPAAHLVCARPIAGIDKAQVGSTLPIAGGAPWPTIEWGEKTGQTVDHVSYTFSVRNMASRVTVKGFGEGSKQLMAVRTSTAHSQMNVCQRDGTFTDQNLRSQTAVNQRADAMIKEVGVPLLHLTATTRPRPLFDVDDVNLGDRFRVKVVDAGLVMGGQLRVMGKSLEIIDSVDEVMVLDLQPDTNSYVDMDIDAPLDPGGYGEI